MKNKKVYIVAAVMILSLLGIVLTIYFEYKNQPKMNDMTSINQENMPSLPDGSFDSSNKDNNWQNRGQNRDNNFNPFDKSLSVLSIVIISICSLIFVSSLLILIKSRFGRLDFKKCFNEKDKKVIFIMESLIVTIVLTFLITFLSNKFILENNSELPGNINNQSRTPFNNKNNNSENSDDQNNADSSDNNL